MVAHNKTSFNMCDDATIGTPNDNLVVQGFMPCPYPSHGIGTWEDPAAACQLGITGGARVGDIALTILCVPISLFCSVFAFMRVYNKVWSKEAMNKPAKMRKRAAADNIGLVSVALGIADSLYMLDVDGRNGFLPFIVPNIFGHFGLFCILTLLFFYTNSVVSIASGAGGGSGDSPTWARRKWSAMLVSFYINILNPILESVLTTKTDTLLSPHFGENGPSNFLGWDSGTLRGIRKLTLVFLVVSYMGACNVHLWQLRKAFAMQSATSTGKAQQSSMKILKKLTRQQVRSVYFATHAPSIRASVLSSGLRLWCV